MLELLRKDNEVYYGTKRLTIVKQSTKGPNKEVVKIEGLPEANGQKWISLIKLHEGINQIECEAREVTSAQSYTLTADEKARINELQAEIKQIIDNAKARYVKKPNLNVDITKLTEQQRLDLIAQLQAYTDSLKA